MSLSLNADKWWFENWKAGWIKKQKQKRQNPDRVKKDSSVVEGTTWDQFDNDANAVDTCLPFRAGMPSTEALHSWWTSVHSFHRMPLFWSGTWEIYSLFLNCLCSILMLGLATVKRVDILSGFRIICELKKKY